MHTVERLELALDLAERLGYSIRQEWLGGVGGGGCEFGGRKWIFVDLALNAVEQLEQVTAALRQDASLHVIDVPSELRGPLGLRRAA